MGYIGTCMCHCEEEGILSRLVWDRVKKSESFDIAWNIIYVTLISVIKSWLRKTVQYMEPQAVNPWFQGVYHIGFVQKIRFPCCLMPTVRHHRPLGDTGTCLWITNIKYSVDFFLSACSHCCSLKRWTNTYFRIFTKWVSCLYILPTNQVFMAVAGRATPLTKCFIAFWWELNLCSVIHWHLEKSDLWTVSWFFFLLKVSSSLTCLIIE